MMSLLLQDLTGDSAAVRVCQLGSRPKISVVERGWLVLAAAAKQRGRKELTR